MQTLGWSAMSQKPYWNGLPSPVEFSTRDALREVQGEHLPTAEDLERLGDIHRQLQKLMVGFHPAAHGHAPLFATIAAVQACGQEWSGQPNIWRVRDSIGPGPPRD